MGKLACVTGDPNKELTEVLRELRMSSEHRSQLKLAIAVDLSRSHISDIECMKSSPTVRVLFDIAKQLDMPLWEIIKKAEERAKQSND
ncbi:MAG: helix-turn-helix transcriptional regulator [Bacteroidota bacterium]